MTSLTPSYADNLLERYRADLEWINRRIRILEWLEEGNRRLCAKRQTGKRRKSHR